MPDDRAVALSWRKSSASATENCVEVAFSDTSILVRDSKQQSSHILAFTSRGWQALLNGIQEGRFDLEVMKASGA
jgi:hypothetical protein